MMSERRERFLTWLLTLVALALLSPLRASGNTLTTGSKSFTYDSENHLTSMTASGTTLVSIAHDEEDEIAELTRRVCTIEDGTIREHRPGTDS